MYQPLLVLTEGVDGNLIEPEEIDRLARLSPGDTLYKNTFEGWRLLEIVECKFRATANAYHLKTSVDHYYISKETINRYLFPLTI